MRELLDNEQRAENAGSWYLKPYLDALVDAVLEVEGSDSMSRGRALALVYSLLGAAHYFAVSQPTLKSIFGARTFSEASTVYEEELRALVRARLQGFKH